MIESQKILILGANGFIGSRISGVFNSKNYNVLGSIRKENWRSKFIKTTVQQVDINADNWRDQITEINPTVIINCIAYGNSSAHENKFLTYKTNVEFLGELLELSVEKLDLKAFIQLGSSSEYGSNCSFANEDFELVPNSHYSSSKGAGSLLCKYFGKEKGLPIVYLRLFSIYGILEDPNRLIPQLIEKGLQNDFPPLASPLIARDFVFIDDLIECIELAIPKAQKLKGEIINVCSGVNTTLSDLCSLMKKEFNIVKDPQFSTLENRAWDIEQWNGNPAKAQKLLGWTTRTDLQLGINKTKKWMIENG